MPELLYRERVVTLGDLSKLPVELAQMRHSGAYKEVKVNRIAGFQPYSLYWLLGISIFLSSWDRHQQSHRLSLIGQRYKCHIRVGNRPCLRE